MITTHHKIREIERELRLRRRVYPRLVQRGRLSPFDAERQIRIFEIILADYKAIEAKESPQKSLF